MSITRPSRLLLFCCAAFAGDFAADLRRGLVTLWAAPRSTDDMPRLETATGSMKTRYRSGSAPSGAANSTAAPRRTSRGQFAQAKKSHERTRENERCFVLICESGGAPRPGEERAPPAIRLRVIRADGRPGDQRPGAHVIFFCRMECRRRARSAAETSNAKVRGLLARAASAERASSWRRRRGPSSPATDPRPRAAPAPTRCAGSARRGRRARASRSARAARRRRRSAPASRRRTRGRRRTVAGSGTAG